MKPTTYLAALLIGTSPLVLAQNIDTGAIQRQSIEQRERQRILEDELREGIRLDADMIVEQPKASNANTSNAEFVLQSIRFSSSKILSREALTELAKPHLGQKVSFEELMQLVESINRTYRERGVLTAQAILPPQKVSNGVIYIRLVEGTVGDVIIEGNNSTKSDWLGKRLPHNKGALVQVNTLQESLHRFNRLYDIQARVELAQGDRFGTTDLHYKIHEPQRHSWQAYYDNNASKTLGQDRVGLQYVNASLTGVRDNLSAGLSRTEGNVSAVVQYSLPVGNSGSRLSYTGIGDRTDFTSQALAEQTITGNAGTHIFNWTQPWYVDQEWKISTSVGFEFSESHTFLEDIEFVDKRSRSYPINLNVSRLTPKGSWYAALGYVRFNVKEDYGRLDDWQSKWTANLARYHVLTDNLAMLFNSALQYSDEKFLDSSEQFYVGSVGSVRGYDLGAKSGAAGYLLNVELQYQLPLSSPDWSVTNVLFVDHGGAFNRNPDTRLVHGSDIISSVGWELKYQYRQLWHLDVAIAYPINDNRVGPDDTSLLHLRTAFVF